MYKCVYLCADLKHSVLPKGLPGPWRGVVPFKDESAARIWRPASTPKVPLSPVSSKPLEASRLRFGASSVCGRTPACCSCNSIDEWDTLVLSPRAWSHVCRAREESHAHSILVPLAVSMMKLKTSTVSFEGSAATTSPRQSNVPCGA